MIGRGKFDEKLSRLAELCVTVGVNLQRNQELIISASLEASEFVRQIARSAYREGAKSVTCIYEDPALIRDWVGTADLDALDYAPDWLHRGVAAALGSGAARLEVAGPYPDLLSGISSDRILRAHRALERASREEARLVSTAAINSSTVPFVTGSWARQVFPGAPLEEAIERLWEAVFEGSRTTCVEPTRAWEMHLDTLDARRDALQRGRFGALRFFDGRTDLTVGLATGRPWLGGRGVAADGVQVSRSIPSEEVFTALDPVRADGHVRFSRPIAIGGALIEDLRVELDRGAVTSVKASNGADFFGRLIASEGAACRLGEVGLVPGSSRIARTGIMFLNPLLDRNAASHVAFGPAPTANLSADRYVSHASSTDGDSNSSLMHIDCMFGHAAMHVDGITEGGSAVPIMRDGEFVI